MDFRIKICGITRVEDAEAAVRAGADAIGINFYPQSPRWVHDDVAERIVAAAGNAACVGVFVNEDPQRINKLARELGLGWVQLHGDEPPEFVAQIDPAVRVLRARRMGDEGLPAVAADLEACADAGRAPDAVLIDGAAPGQYGGTGETADWATLADFRELVALRGTIRNIPLVLAGGLNAENIGTAIAAVKPDAVDTASGVESAPGVKDHALVQEFVAAAQAYTG